MKTTSKKNTKKSSIGPSCGAFCAAWWAFFILERLIIFLDKKYWINFKYYNSFGFILEFLIPWEFLWNGNERKFELCHLVHNLNFTVFQVKMQKLWHFIDFGFLYWALIHLDAKCSIDHLSYSFLMGRLWDSIAFKLIDFLINSGI